MYVVNKDGLVHYCDTPERYKAFKAAGWADYVPPEQSKGKPTDKDTKGKSADK